MVDKGDGKRERDKGKDELRGREGRRWEREIERERDRMEK